MAHEDPNNPETGDADNLGIQSDKPWYTGHENDPVTIRIDGEEKQVPFLEAINNYQLVAASTKRFQEAKRLREEAETMKTVPPKKTDDDGEYPADDATWLNFLKSTHRTFGKDISPDRFKEMVGEVTKDSLLQWEATRETERAMEENPRLVEILGGEETARAVLWEQLRSATAESGASFRKSLKGIVEKLSAKLPKEEGVDVDREKIKNFKPERKGAPVTTQEKRPDVVDKKTGEIKDGAITAFVNDAVKRGEVSGVERE